MPIANMQFGIAQARLKNYPDAVPALQKAAKLLPENGMGRYELVWGLFETGKWAEAAPEFSGRRKGSEVGGCPIFLGRGVCAN